MLKPAKILLHGSARYQGLLEARKTNKALAPYLKDCQ